MQNPILKQALINAGLTALYIVLVATFMFNSQKFLPLPHEPSILYPISALLVFVFSATVCGYLFLGKPILWYLDGKKQEALKLFGYSLGSFFVIGLIIISILFIVTVG